MDGRFSEIKKAACNALDAVALVDLNVEEAKAALVLAAKLLGMTSISEGLNVNFLRAYLTEEMAADLIQIQQD